MRNYWIGILLGFAAGVAVGMGIAVYIAMHTTGMDFIYPAVNQLWL